MKLALVSPLPPVASAASSVVAELVETLRKSAELILLPHAPEQVDAATSRLVPVAPCSDLPHLLQTGAVDLPVYFVVDELSHAYQMRYVRECPGLLVLLSLGAHRVLAALTEESGDLPAYRELLVEEYGEVAEQWPERFVWRVERDRLRDRLPMTGVLCTRSAAVLAPSPIASRIRRRHPEVPVTDLAVTHDSAILADAILVAAARAIAAPRVIAPLRDRSWPAVEVVIVAFNSREIIGDAIQSILDQDYPSLKCTVVDNASSDGTAEYIKDRFELVEVVSSPKNLGFAGGNNLAFARSTAKYLVLFNQDAVARRNFVQELVRVAERDSDVAAVGAKMLMMRCPTILNSTGIVINEGGFAVDRQIGEKDEDVSPIPVRVFGACGGAQLLRRSIVEEVGGFDEAFFMYLEDVDLSWRIRLAGKEILYAPMAVVHHDWHGDLDSPEEQASGLDAKTVRRRSLCERNRLQCLIKNLKFSGVVKALRALRRYDAHRLKALRSAMGRGGDRDYLRMIVAAIKGSWRWCASRSFQLWLRRRATQRIRRVSDEELAPLVEEGLGEPSHVGDLEIVQDSSSAEADPRLLMGVNDRKSLGPGWHGVEVVDGQDWNLRWSKGRAWLYLSVPRTVTKFLVRVSRGQVPTELHVQIGTQDLGSLPVADHDMHVMTFDLLTPLDARDLVEVRLGCETFCPSDEHGGGDHRTLGIRLAEAWLE